MIWGVFGIAFLVAFCAWSKRRRRDSGKRMLEPGDPRLIPAVKRMIAIGDKPLAIMMYQDATGKSEKEATEAVEAIVRDLSA